MGAFGKSVYDVACLLDVLIPGRGFQAGSTTSHPELAIGVSNERISAITEEEEALFIEVQDLLGPMITARDIRVPLHKEAKDEGCVNVLVGQPLKEAWDAYLRDVDGPIRSLQDIVNWHSQHPVSVHVLNEEEGCLKPVRVIPPRSPWTVVTGRSSEAMAGRQAVSNRSDRSAAQAQLHARHGLAELRRHHLSLGWMGAPTCWSCQTPSRMS